MTRQVVVRPGSPTVLVLMAAIEREHTELMFLIIRLIRQAETDPFSAAENHFIPEIFLYLFLCFELETGEIVLV